MLPHRLAEVPDWAGADGRRVGWSVGAWLYRLGGADVRLPAPVEDAALAPDRWTFATARGFATDDGVEVRVDRGLARLPGRDVCVVVDVPEHRVIPDLSLP